MMIIPILPLSNYFTIFIDHREYFAIIKDDLDRLMVNDNKLGNRAQFINDELE